MGIFKSQDQKVNEARERNRIAGENAAALYHLRDFSEDEKLLLGYICNYNFKGNTLIDLSALMSGNDSAKLWNIQSLQNATSQQGWMIARLLKDLNNKLDTIIERLPVTEAED